MYINVITTQNFLGPNQTKFLVITYEFFTPPFQKYPIPLLRAFLSNQSRILRVYQSSIQSTQNFLGPNQTKFLVILSK